MLYFVVLITVIALQSHMGKACRTSGWSQWINDYKPSSTPFPEEVREGIHTQTGGDKENMNSTERDIFCPPGHGTISDIECQTNDGKQYSSTGQKQLKCLVDEGFSCSNRLIGNGQCLDYKIRLYCQCSNPLPPSTPATPSTAQSTGQRIFPGLLTGASYSTGAKISTKPNSGLQTLVSYLTNGRIQSPDSHATARVKNRKETIPTSVAVTQTSNKVNGGAATSGHLATTSNKTSVAKSAGDGGIKAGHRNEGSKVGHIWTLFTTFLYILTACDFFRKG